MFSTFYEDYLKRSVKSYIIPIKAINKPILPALNRSQGNVHAFFFFFFSEKVASTLAYTFVDSLFSGEVLSHKTDYKYKKFFEFH